MTNEKDSQGLNVIANLLALQLIQDKELGEAAWLLRRAGMDYSSISQLLSISEDSVRAHVSSKRKQLEKSAKQSGKRGK